MEKINFSDRESIERIIGDCQSFIRRESEDFLRDIISSGYRERSENFWNRDYSSIENYLNSVKEARKLWKEFLGDFSEYYADDFQPENEKIFEDENCEMFFISIQVYKKMRGYALMGYPKNAKSPYPLVIAQHGISSSPFHVMGFYDHGNLYHGFGMELLKKGYAVMAPFNITLAPSRARLQRMCILMRKSLPGLEVGKYKKWIDFLSVKKEIDEKRTAMWGLSLGGYYTLLTLPVEKRIKVGICAAFFNHRIKKMIIDDPRYSCFLSTTEEHIFIPGWLTYFSDYDLLSLICPRPFMVQTGKQDAVSWHELLVEEFNKSKKHYEKLNIAEKIKLDIHSGGHEIRVKEGLNFLKENL
jgi:dienelactone hydrolase